MWTPSRFQHPQLPMITCQWDYSILETKSVRVKKRKKQNQLTINQPLNQLLCTCIWPSLLFDWTENAWRHIFFKHIVCRVLTKHWKQYSSCNSKAGRRKDKRKKKIRTIDWKSSPSLFNTLEETNKVLILKEDETCCKVMSLHYMSISYFL